MMRMVAAFRDCIDMAQFNSISAKGEKRMSLFSFPSNVAHEDLHRLRTAAKLGSNLFQIQMQIEQYTISHQALSDVARESHARGDMSESDLWIMYRRIKEAELQKMALAKSERIIRVTLTGLENQATMEKMRNVLEHTVHQHRMVQDNGSLESSSERLMETFESVSQHIAQGQTAMDNIDAQNDDINVDADTNGTELALDNNFNMWKLSLVADTPATYATAVTAALKGRAAHANATHILIQPPHSTNVIEEDPVAA